MGVKPGYKRTEVGVIPEEWEVIPLGAVAQFRTGPFGSALHKSDYTTDGIPVINPMHIIDGELSPSTQMSITEVAAQQLSEFRLKAGEVVLGRRGDMGRCALVQRQHEGWLCGTGSMIVRPGSAVDPGFLSRVLSSPSVVASIEEASVGSTMINLNQGTLKSLLVQLPPVSEQRAIATALSDVDALLTQLDRLIAKKRDIKRAAMQQLLTGKTRLPGFSGKWSSKRMGECLVSRPDYGINAPAVPYSDRLPTYLRITDITDDGRMSSANRVSVDHDASHDFVLSAGDLVFARTGASVGKSYLYTPRDGELVFAGFLIRVRPDANCLNPWFLYAYTKSAAYWQWVKVMSMRSGQPGINGNEYAELPILLPAIAEQTAIATLLSDLDAELAALEARRDKTRALKQGMMQELLTGRTRLV